MSDPFEKAPDDLTLQAELRDDAGASDESALAAAGPDDVKVEGGKFEEPDVAAADDPVETAADDSAEQA
jgi:hypothetical protein